MALAPVSKKGSTASGTKVALPCFAESLGGEFKVRVLERRGELPGHCSSLFESSELILSPAVLEVSEAGNVAEWPALDGKGA